MTSATPPNTWLWRTTALAIVVLLLCGETTHCAAPPVRTPQFTRDVVPLVNLYCIRCHGAAKPKGGLSLAKFTGDPAGKNSRALWEKVADNLRSGEMPPSGAKRPTAAELDLWNRWLDAVVLKSDCRGPKDPGRVTIRRLNRAEYNNTIRDLVGVDFSRPRISRPTMSVMDSTTSATCCPCRRCSWRSTCRRREDRRGSLPIARVRGGD